VAAPQQVEPVKRLVALLGREEAACQRARRLLERQWGPLDFSGDAHPFDVTDYYTPEMGPGLQRRLLAFARLMPPEQLREFKLACNDIERELSRDGRRLVNLDAGYLDHSKLVLASMKFAGQKIHLGSGVWADLILRWERGAWRPFPWSFPDFRDGRYQQELSALRRLYLEQLRQQRREERC